MKTPIQWKRIRFGLESCWRYISRIRADDLSEALRVSLHLPTVRNVGIRKIVLKAFLVTVSISTYFAHMRIGCICAQFAIVVYQRKRTIWGRITVQLVSSLTGFHSTVSLHTNNNIFYSLVKSNLGKLMTSWTAEYVTPHS